MSKHNRRRKPQQITEQQTTLQQVDRLAWLLDNSIRIPIINYRIGLDAVIGLIPGLGDIAGMILSSFIVLQAIRLGASRTILARMVLNIGIEAIIGMLPVAGDLFDAAFKANIRNAQLLHHLRNGLPTHRSMPPLVNRWVIIAVIGALLAIFVLAGWGSLLLLQWLYSFVTA